MAALANDDARTALEIVPAETSIGELLRTMRQARGWSQETLGRKAGVHETTVNYVERGINRPLYSTWLKIAEAFALRGAERAWFLGLVPFVMTRRSITPAARGRFGRLLQRYRRRADLSQQALAALAGCNAASINRLESGERNQPAAQFVAAFARALKLSPEEADTLMIAAGLAPSFVEDRTVRQLVRLLAGDAVLAAAVRAQVAALDRMTRDGDEG